MFGLAFRLNLEHNGALGTWESLTRSHRKDGAAPVDDDQEGQAEINRARRRFARFSVSLPALVRASQLGEQAVPATVWTVSAGGLTMDLPVALATGTSVALVLQTRQGPLDLEGRIVWAHPTKDVVFHGLAFPEPKDQEFALDLFLSENR